MTTAYVDTCVISGLHKFDLAEPDESALLQILQCMKAGQVSLVTSEVAAKELQGVSTIARKGHEVIYGLLADVPIARTAYTDSGLTLMGVGGGSRLDPLYAQLEKLLPDKADAEHAFQAAKNSVEYLITVDRKSFLAHASAVEALTGVKLRTPPEFLLEIR